MQIAEQQLNAEFPGKIASAHIDVTDEEEIIAVVKRAALEMGGVDVLINNAGVNHHRSHSHESQAAEFERVLSINLRGVLLFSLEALKQFLSQGSGVIINNSSNHEIIPKPEFLAYAVSKAGMGNLTRTLALEYADRGIRVNVVAPGATLTPLNSSGPKIEYTAKESKAISVWAVRPNQQK